MEFEEKIEKLTQIYLRAKDAVEGKEPEEWKERFLPFMDEIDKLNQDSFIIFGIASQFDKIYLGVSGPYWWRPFGCPAANSNFEHKGKSWKSTGHGLLTFSKTPCKQ